MDFTPTGAQEEVYEFLLSAPDLERIIASTPSAQVQERVRYLLDGNRNGTLTAIGRVTARLLHCR